MQPRPADANFYSHRAPHNLSPPSSAVRRARHQCLACLANGRRFEGVPPGEANRVSQVVRYLIDFIMCA